MQLVILHYHLNRGGVTSVVENHLRSLALLGSAEAPTRVAIVYGGRAAAWNQQLAAALPFECSLISVPELEYDEMQATAGQLYDALLVVLNQFERDSTVLHIHNHSLGKNAALPPVVCRLAAAAWRLLLQIHDFAEDLRPTNYRHLLGPADSWQELRRQLYPQAAQIHYAVLNRRDQQSLARAGVAGERLHLLPNPVRAPPDVPPAGPLQSSRAELAAALKLPPGNRWVLYPVRPIRRKNLGELLLWSLLAEETTFALTLAPLNPREKLAYQRWVEFATELQLPVEFEVASRTQLPFTEVYAAADAIITTSVAEGFGMVFLEASLARQQLVGRSLAGVCDDFVTAGMQFPGLAETMQIPAAEIDCSELRQAQVRGIEELRTAYGLPPASAEAWAAVETAFSGDTVDFGRLESDQQKVLLRRLHSEAALRDDLRDLNPIVQTIGAVDEVDLQRTFKNNCRVIAENYSPPVIGRQLSSIYQAILASTPGPVARESSVALAILNRFVHPSQFFPIRLES